MAFAFNAHDMWTLVLSVSHLSIKEEERLSRLPAMPIIRNKEREARYSGKLFQHKSIDGLKDEKWPTVPLYLNELPN